MKVALIRHPKPLIAPGICYGRLDIPVDPAAAGDIDAIATDSGLRGAEKVWTSPARRCRQLADAIAMALDAPLSIDARLQELDFGDWEGLSWEAVPRAELDRWAASPLTFTPPRGESGAALLARVRDFETVLRRDRQDCVVVSHGGPLKLLNALLNERAVDLLASTPPFGRINHVDCRPM
nr:histidine phosphatase family protein [uncultured Rhodopila sp.]